MSNRSHATVQTQGGLSFDVLAAYVYILRSILHHKVAGVTKIPRVTDNLVKCAEAAGRHLLRKQALVELLKT